MNIDYTSSAAQSYQTLLKKELEEWRIKNDDLSLSEAETNQIRGRIALLKKLIALPELERVKDAQSRFGQPE